MSGENYYIIMDSLQIELAKLRRDANLYKSIEDVDSIIEQLERARQAVVSGIIIPFKILRSSLTIS